MKISSSHNLQDLINAETGLPVGQIDAIGASQPWQGHESCNGQQNELHLQQVSLKEDQEKKSDANLVNGTAPQ